MYTKTVFSFVLALAATALVSASHTAVADEAIDEIVVKAPVMQHIPVSTDSGIKVDLIEVNARVSYADLDLKKNADITKLMTRIETSAKESCEKLSDSFPLDMDRHAVQRCADETVADARQQLSAAIVAANPPRVNTTQSVR